MHDAWIKNYRIHTYKYSWYIMQNIVEGVVCMCYPAAAIIASFHVKLAGYISPLVAQQQYPKMFPKNVWMVVQVALSTSKDDHQSRKRFLLQIQDDGCWGIVSAEI